MLTISGIAALSSLAVAVPAQALGPIKIPDPSNLALFAIGVVGLLIGRRNGRK